MANSYEVRVFRVENIKDEEVKKYFRVFGKIIKVSRLHGTSSGEALLEFSDKKGVVKVLERREHKIGSETVIVSEPVLKPFLQCQAVINEAVRDLLGPDHVKKILIKIFGDENGFDENVIKGSLEQLQQVEEQLNRRLEVFEQSTTDRDSKSESKPSSITEQSKSSQETNRINRGASMDGNDDGVNTSKNNNHLQPKEQNKIHVVGQKKEEKTRHTDLTHSNRKKKPTVKVKPPTDDSKNKDESGNLTNPPPVPQSAEVTEYNKEGADRGKSDPFTTVPVDTWLYFDLTDKNTIATIEENYSVKIDVEHKDDDRVCITFQCTSEKGDVLNAKEALHQKLNGIKCSKEFLRIRLGQGVDSDDIKLIMYEIRGMYFNVVCTSKCSSTMSEVTFIGSNNDIEKAKRNFINLLPQQNPSSGSRRSHLSTTV